MQEAHPLHKTKLYKTLFSLSKADQNRLKKFIQSEYCNPNKAVKNLVLALLQKNVIPVEYSSHLWDTCHAIEKYTETGFRKLMSDSLKKIEQFLVYEEIKSNQIDYNRILTNTVESRKISVLTKQVVKRTKSELQRQPYRSSEYHLGLYHFYKAQYDIDKIELKRAARKTNYKINISNIIHHLDIFYSIEKLRYFNALISWSRIRKDNLDYNNMDSFIENLNREDLKSPSVNAQIAVHHALRHSDLTEYYTKLKEAIINDISKLKSDEAKDVFDAATNFCLYKINHGETNFLIELFELYKLGLNNNILTPNGQISPWTFKNIVSVGLRIKEFKYVDFFIKKYSNWIPSTHQTSISALSKAQLNYYLGNYEDSIQNLQDVIFNEFSLKVDAEVTLLATYYELDNYSLLYDHINKFNTYLSRQKDASISQVKFYKNLLRFVKKIMHSSKSDLIKIKEEIMQTKGLASKTWLLEKVDELLGENKESPSLEKEDS